MKFDEDRFGQLIQSLERLAGGDLAHTVSISAAHDELDAIAFGINVLVGELRYTGQDLHRAKEEAERADRAKTVFLRNVSHDIRTPLTAILSLAELLAEPGIDGPRRVDLVARVQSNARALVSLVDDLLDLSKVEAGMLAFEISPLGPREAVAEVVRNFELQALDKGIRIHIESGADVPVTIASDGRRVRQVLTNVIGNALKFTARGEIGVRVHAVDELLLAIDVRDTGIGISPADQRELFLPFQQANASIARTHGGTGLGLILSKRLARGLGGDLVLLASQPDDGSTFRITLRTHADRVEHIAALPRAPVKLPPRPLQGLRILVAEDNEDIRLAITDLLVFGGAEIVQVEDGRAAVTRALDGPFDTVLMDVRMPVLDGLEATRLLRLRGSRVPIVALTADAMIEHRNECVAAGYDDYLAKPVDYAQLVDVVLRNRRPA